MFHKTERRELVSDRDPRKVYSDASVIPPQLTSMVRSCRSMVFCEYDKRRMTWVQGEWGYVCIECGNRVRVTPEKTE